MTVVNGSWLNATPFDRPFKTCWASTWTMWVFLLLLYFHNWIATAFISVCAPVSHTSVKTSVLIKTGLVINLWLFLVKLTFYLEVNTSISGDISCINLSVLKEGCIVCCYCIFLCLKRFNRLFPCLIWGPRDRGLARCTPCKAPL